MRVVLPTDVFPPGSVGGAAWSTHALARALMQCGHRVTAVVPVRGKSGLAAGDALGVPIMRCGYPAPAVPFLQNYLRHERLWSPLARLIQAVAAGTDLDNLDQTVVRGNGSVRQPASRQLPAIVHAQHVQVTPAAVMAARKLQIPVVVTVRDHWPWHYFATGLHGDQIPYPYPLSGLPALAAYTTELVARLGALPGSLSLIALPYLLGHTRRRAAWLARADAIVAVSHYIAERLQTIVPAHRVHVVPNLVNTQAVTTIAAQPLHTPLAAPFVLFVGKLERNKGAGLLEAIFRALAVQTNATDVPVLTTTNVLPSGLHTTNLATCVIAGNGALESELRQALAQLGITAYFLSWADHDEVLRLMARCSALLFPSVWGEPLSRVLLEAGALGAPIVAMPTGGTTDIITDNVNGLLAPTPELFARQLQRLLADPALRRRLGDQARLTVQQRFSASVVVPQLERLYSTLWHQRKQ